MTQEVAWRLAPERALTTGDVEELASTLQAMPHLGCGVWWRAGEPLFWGQSSFDEEAVDRLLELGRALQALVGGELEVGDAQGLFGRALVLPSTGLVVVARAAEDPAALIQVAHPAGVARLLRLADEHGLLFLAIEPATFRVVLRPNGPTLEALLALCARVSSEEGCAATVRGPDGSSRTIQAGLVVVRPNGCADLGAHTSTLQALQGAGILRHHLVPVDQLGDLALTPAGVPKARCDLVDWVHKDGLEVRFQMSHRASVLVCADKEPADGTPRLKMEVPEGAALRVRIPDDALGAEGVRLVFCVKQGVVLSEAQPCPRKGQTLLGTSVYAGGATLQWRVSQRSDGARRLLAASAEVTLPVDVEWVDLALVARASSSMQEKCRHELRVDTTGNVEWGGFVERLSRYDNVTLEVVVMKQVMRCQLGAS